MKLKVIGRKKNHVSLPLLSEGINLIGLSSAHKPLVESSNLSLAREYPPIAIAIQSPIRQLPSRTSVPIPAGQPISQAVGTLLKGNCAMCLGSKARWRSPSNDHGL